MPNASTEDSASTEDNESLLQFLYQTPYGVIRADSQGNIDLMNAYAVRYLAQISTMNDYSRLDPILSLFSEELPNQVHCYEKSSGIIVEDMRCHFQTQEAKTLTLDLQITKVSKEYLMVGFNDTTQVVEREQEAREAAEKRAESNARLEVATSVIHDIGNAITAVGINAAKILADDTWPEISNLDRLKGLLQTKIADLNVLFGAQKGDAMIEFINSIETSLQQRSEEELATAKSIAKNIHHIQDIIRIQKQFARDGSGAPLKPVDLSEICNHASSIITEAIMRNNINFKQQYPDDPIYVNGDKTRLTQVLVNLLKNANEAITSNSANQIAGELILKVTRSHDNNAVILILDNGIGFDAATAERIAHENFTSKDEGSGLGLASVRAVLESHHGEMTIKSEGTNQGCTVTLRLPCLETYTLEKE